MQHRDDPSFTEHDSIPPRWTDSVRRQFAARLRRDTTSSRYARIDPGRKAVLSMVLVVVVVSLIGGLWLLRSRPHRLVSVDTISAGASGVAGASGSADVPKPSITAGRVSSTTPAATAPVVGSATASAGGLAGSSGGSSTASAAPLLVVDVVGTVKHPGVYRLAPGARVLDAVQAAGGPSRGADLTTVNLARRLIDGEQIAIGVPGAPGGVVAAPSGTSGSSTAPASASSPLDLNTADAAALDALPGVGPALAQHILDWRSAHGRFSSVSQLNDVSGIGDAKFAELKELVTVS